MSAQSPPPDQLRTPKTEGRGGRERLRALGMLGGAVVFVAFALVNLEQVKVDWIIGSGHAPLIVVIAISALVGIVLTYSGERLSRKRRRR